MPVRLFSSTKPPRRRVLTIIERAAVANTLGDAAWVARRWRISVATVRRIRREFREQYRPARIEAPTLTPIGNLNDLLTAVES